MAFRLPSWAPGVTGLWTPEPTGADAVQILALLEWIRSGRQVEAHNAWFERCLWQNVLAPRYAFPPVGARQWRCSAAKAAAHTLPRGLDAALEAMGLVERKDPAGSKVMMKMAKPRKPRKVERAAGLADAVLWHDTPELRSQLYAYCRQDVLAEAALSEALSDLSPAETSVYLLDQRINERGFQIDHGAVHRALALIGQEQERCNAELVRLTGGSPDKATKRALMLRWFQQNGLPQMPDTRKETVEGYLASDSLPAKARQGLVLLRTLGRSSTAKYEAMDRWADPGDGRVRGGLVYHGAGTGRWSGAGVQPQNFPRGELKQSMDVTWDALMSPTPPENLMEVLSYAIRGAITASPGHVLYVADYAAIEARVLLWLAGDETALETFRDGRDIYLEMAASISGRVCTKADKDERALGKVAILGLGYQMGAAKFQDTALVMGGVTIDEDMSQQVVDAYRAKFWRVKDMWRETEEAAIEATCTKRPVVNGYTTWVREGKFLFCELPSGRRLAYPFPETRPTMTPWGDMRTQLTFMGVSQLAHRWQRTHTYGGSLVENITQAVARDLMAAALLRCEHSEIYTPVLSVHDEMIAEAVDGTGNVREFEALMAEVPDWAEGLPVAAEGWSGFRYRK